MKIDDYLEFGKDYVCSLHQLPGHWVIVHCHH